MNLVELKIRLYSLWKRKKKKKNRSSPPPDPKRYNYKIKLKNIFSETKTNFTSWKITKCRNQTVTRQQATISICWLIRPAKFPHGSCKNQ